MPRASCTPTARPATPSDGAFVAPMLLRFADAASPALHEVEAFGPVASIVGYGTLDEATALVARGGGSLVTSVATHDPAVGDRAHVGHRRVQRPRALPRPRRRPQLDRARLAAAEPRARRTGARRRRRGAGRHPCRAAPHAAHRGAGLARDAHGAHRGVARGCRVAARRRAPVPQVAGRAAHRRPGRVGVAHGDPRGHRDVRRVHGRHVLRAHGRGGGGREPVLPRPGRARVPARLVGGGALRGCGAGPRARQLGTREPAVHHAGVARATRSASSSRRSRSRRARPTSTARCAGTPC